jgi:hypothetical protein
VAAAREAELGDDAMSVTRRMKSGHREDSRWRLQMTTLAM